MRLDNAKILISDDSILARKQLKDFISKYGTPTFFEASNGQDAIDIYKKEKPDLSFLDIVMPVKDGNAAIREIIDFDKDALIIISPSLRFKNKINPYFAFFREKTTRILYITIACPFFLV